MTEQVNLDAYPCGSRECVLLGCQNPRACFGDRAPEVVDEGPVQTAPDPLRVQVLYEGAEITAGDRNAAYGDPLPNFELQGKLASLFWEYVAAYGQRVHGPAERAAIEMIFCKLARIGLGTLKRDNNVDLSTYSAIAFEVAERAAAPGGALVTAPPGRR